MPTDVKLYTIAGKGVQSATISVFPIELYARDIFNDEVCIGVATAFCDRWAGDLYLITNWHNVTGRDPMTGQPRAEDGQVPAFVRAYFLNREYLPEGKAAFRPRGVSHVDFPVHIGSPNNWLMHKIGQDVDLAATKIMETKNHFFVPMNEAVGVFDPVLSVGGELYILGFPRGLKPIGNFPIWKRASIATEPQFMANFERCLWVDSATREGMSGSPVVARALSVDDDKRLIGNGPINGQTIIVSQPGLAFVGVYSGRVGLKDALEAQLGKVWHSQLVQELLNHPVPLDFVLR